MRKRDRFNGQQDRISSGTDDDKDDGKDRRTSRKEEKENEGGKDKKGKKERERNEERKKKRKGKKQRMKERVACVISHWFILAGQESFGNSASRTERDGNIIAAALRNCPLVCTYEAGRPADWSVGWVDGWMVGLLAHPNALQSWGVACITFGVVSVILEKYCRRYLCRDKFVSTTSTGQNKFVRVLVGVIIGFS